MLDLKLEMVLLITIILDKGAPVAGFSKRMQCPVSLDTVEPVRRCPLKKIDWEEKESIWKCGEKNQNCSSPSDFRYHCVRDSYGNLIEVCAPSTILKGKKCPEFNYGGERIQEDYTHTGVCRQCPFSYASNMVFYYLECLKTIHGTALNSNIQSSFGTSTSLNSNTMTKDDEPNMTWIIIVSITSVVIIVILVLVIKRFLWNDAPKKDMHYEMEQIVDEREAETVSKGCLEGKANKLEKDEENEHFIIKSNEKTKTKDEICSLLEQTIEVEITTHPSIYYKGRFAKINGTKDDKEDKGCQEL